MDAAIVIEGLTKEYMRPGGSPVLAVNNVSLTVERGELLVLLGPSGCGKTTLLRSIAGLEKPTRGKIVGPNGVLFDAASRVDLPIETRRIGMVFQSYALWPHKTVIGNVAYPLSTQNLGAEQAQETALAILEKMGIEDVAQQFPNTISGGQQQRAALARAIVATKDVVLFDEPLSNVDALVRTRLRAEIVAMQREFGFTGVYVTHDQEEAMALATRVAVLENGVIRQLGTPQEIYHRPRSPYVARFVGSTNEFTCVVQSAWEGRLRVGHEVLGPLVCDSPAAGGASSGTSVLVMSRPENWRLHTAAPTDSVNTWEGSIVESTFLGSRVEYTVDVSGVGLKIHELSSRTHEIGQSVHVTIQPSFLMVLPSPIYTNVP